MQVILQKDVSGLGRKGDIREVADGYGRNYLLPQRLAFRATAGNLALLAEGERRKEKQEAAQKAEAERLASQLQKKEISLALRVGETGKVFGAITSKDICRAVAETYGISLRKYAVLLGSPLRKLGTESVILRLHPACKVALTVHIVAEQEKVESE